MGTLSGMTGFARTEGAHENLSWVWEVRSVNGKGLDVRFRLPGGYERFEAKARELAKARFVRGNIQASLNLSIDRAGSDIRLDTDRIDHILKLAEPYITSGQVSPPSFDGLLAIRGVLDVEDAAEDVDQETLDKAILASLVSVLDQLLEARRDEGAALSGVLSGFVDSIEALTVEANANAALRIENIRDRIAAKYEELLPEGLPEDRMAMEAASMAVKLDVREEIDRLRAHIDSARKLLANGSPTGRKLDFLTQEFNREANTLCSKSADSDLTQIGLAMKNAVDQLREQVQNVE